MDNRPFTLHCLNEALCKDHFYVVTYRLAVFVTFAHVGGCDGHFPLGFSLINRINSGRLLRIIQYLSFKQFYTFSENFVTREL